MTGYSRWVVFARVRGQIRCYAAPIPWGGDTCASTRDPARLAAIEAEDSDYGDTILRELAILPSVADAVTLTAEYLGGTPLRDVRVPRLPPPWTVQPAG